MNDITNLHFYPSDFTHESRILKETKTLADAGIDKIYIVAIWKAGLKENEQLNNRREVWRVRLKSAILSTVVLGKLIQHLEWAIRIIFRFKNKPVQLVNCHNLSSLPIGILFKMFWGSKVIYDTHELETERNGWSKSRRTISKFLEKILIYQADAVIVVNESIAEWYKQNYSLKEVYAIYNFPPKQIRRGGDRSNILKKLFNIQDDEMLLIYQGALGEGRFIDLLLDIFSRNEKQKHIVFMGYGSLENKIKEYADKFSNIHFQSAVKPEDVINYTQGADVGLSLIENSCLSYYLSLPNKMIEYISAGVPVITTNFPEPAKIIDKCQCGWKVSPDKQAILKLIKNITKEEIAKKKNNTLKCVDDFSWETEKEKLLTLFYTLNIKTKAI